MPSSENSVPCLNFEFSRLWITFVSSEVVEIFSFAISFLGHWDYLWSSLVAQRLQCLPAVWETHVWSLGQEDPQRRKWQPTWYSCLGYSPWGCKELDTIEWLHFPFSGTLSVSFVASLLLASLSLLFSLFKTCFLRFAFLCYCLLHLLSAASSLSFCSICFVSTSSSLSFHHTLD